MCGVGSAVVGCARVDDSACLAWEERDADEVVAVLRAQQDAWNAGDIAGFLDGYVRDEGLVFTSGAKVRRGFEETRKKFESRYGTSKDTMGHLEFEIESVQHMGADGAVVLGRWELTKTAELDLSFVKDIPALKTAEERECLIELEEIHAQQNTIDDELLAMDDSALRRTLGARPLLPRSDDPQIASWVEELQQIRQLATGRPLQTQIVWRLCGAQ